ncbi:hypothetical protein GW819_01995 [Candidatus Gracilibacteria bacterium]|nr:hypothetical protein [Candidatus Gracilibacteria bacterium]OIO77662.1 MAG: hypothetical protein AUJ87_00850 [Candidatus Gracilibacteria bacterium CG1_02_38_174]PIQ11456.1 MAG: hypothetical protein COW68_02570 [Candidatus Gracilibacteria bacterium CG18_big_fil_WC_8_21_14_2_50_38_16]PIQ41855.1 MAG: hypothetical protein COW06_01590 [Candidatus Gracilibacteria bacterium CG12_big_fil_rev_8_21_14_0_65_38_15]PIZ02060.1 MAG: hypothetical protein COY60_00285 [Candidatus Gracilibacteria bacterium CG_4
MKNTNNKKNTSQTKPISGGKEVITELIRVGDTVVSIIDNEELKYIERPLTQENLVSRLKIIIIHLTKGLAEKGEWIISNDDLQVFIAYFTWDKNDYESIVDHIRGKNQLQFDEELVRRIAKLIMGDTLSNNASLKISRKNEIEKVLSLSELDTPTTQVNNSLNDFKELGQDLYEMSLTIEELPINGKEKEKLTTKLNKAIETYMKLMDK